MTEKVTSEDGAEPQPSASNTERVAISEAEAKENELDAKVIESLGDRYIPLDSEDAEQNAKDSENEKPKEDQKPDGEEGQKTEGEQGKEEVVEMPKIPPVESKPSKLDKRVATLYIQNLLLSGEKSVPSVDEVIEDLRSVPMDQKIEAMHYHRLRQKELRGIKSDGNDSLDAEDSEAIRDADRENIRQEILSEEHDRQVKQSFVQFIGAHPELDESKKDSYQPKLARAVEILWRGGMPIEEAYDTVTDSISSVKESTEKIERKEKQRAFSGAISASGNANPSSSNGPTWEEMALLQNEDPVEYNRLIKAGYVPKS